MRLTLRDFARFGKFALFFFAFAATSVLAADDGLKFIHNPGGGEIVYGPVIGQTTMPTAMGFMLKQVHGHFGDKPQVGKFFHTTGSNSIATFFTLTDKTHDQKHIAGLVIVSMGDGGKPSAAVVYDEAQRFSTTANPMMKKLNEVWHTDAPKGGTAAGGANGSEGPVAPLHPTRFPDNSGSIGLPDGWQIQSSNMGTVHAQGSNGESIHIGVYIPMMDPTVPSERQMIQLETQGGRIPLPGMYVAYPYGRDPEATLRAISTQLHAKQRKPPASINVTATEPQGNGCTHFKTEVDDHDGKGFQFSSIMLCMMRPMSPGLWGVSINQAIVPKNLVEKERATIVAMYKSYRTNDAVINSESQAAINNIHEIGRRAQIQADASHAAWDIHQQAYNHQQDVQDRSNQAFSNYLLDQTVIQDNQRNERGTVYNGYADALVKADPNRYQYVPTQDFLKGIDY